MTKTLVTVYRLPDSRIFGTLEGSDGFNNFSICTEPTSVLTVAEYVAEITDRYTNLNIDIVPEEHGIDDENLDILTVVYKKEHELPDLNDSII